MNPAYTLRLFCLSLASFLVVNLAAGLVVSALSNAAIGLARRMRARDGARLLLVLRLAPATLGACVVAGLCVPSYLWMEPEAIDEPVGWLCLLAAGLAVVSGLLPAIRAGHAVVRSRRYLRRFQACEQVLCVSGERFTVRVMKGREPLFALAGIVRRRLMVSECAIDAFPADELLCALRHEQAHGESHDNLKHFLMLLAPDMLPLVHSLRPLERAWAMLAEWAADDRASTGSADRSVSLAAALVRAARVTASPAPLPDLVTAMVENGEDLSARVDRLLRSGSDAEHWCQAAVCAAGALVFACVAILAMRPGKLAFAHSMLERLVRWQ